MRSVAGSIQGEADHGRDKEIGALEQIRPPALYGVSTAIGIRRRSNVFELADGARLSESHRLLEQCVVGHPIVSLRVRHLTGADERGKKVGPRLRHEDTKNRTPGMTDEDDLVLLQDSAERLRELDSVLSQAIDRDRRSHRRSALSERSACTPLIPLNDREGLQPRTKGGIAPWIGGVARAAVQKEKHGIAAIVAANRDPLLDAANHDVAAFIDPAGRNGVIARVSLAHERRRGIQPLDVRGIQLLYVRSDLTDSSRAYSRRRCRDDCGAEAQEREDSDRCSFHDRSHVGAVASVERVKRWRTRAHIAPRLGR